MGTNIAAEHTPSLSGNFNHLLPVGGQCHRFAHAWIIKRGFAEVHDKSIPAGAWSESHDCVGEVLFQDVGLGSFEMAANPRHGQLPRPEGGEDLGQIIHHYGLVPVYVWEARFPV